MLSNIYIEVCIFLEDINYILWDSLCFCATNCICFGTLKVLLLIIPDPKTLHPVFPVNDSMADLIMYFTVLQVIGKICRLRYIRIFIETGEILITQFINEPKRQNRH